nr:DUF58 domain-containing protein [Teredinibacter turnerae]
MRPSRYLLLYVLAMLFAGLVLFGLRLIQPEAIAQDSLRAGGFTLLGTTVQLWFIAAAYLIGAAVFDLFRHRRFKHVEVERVLPHSLALGVPAFVQWRVHNHYVFPLHIELMDYVPPLLSAEDLPVRLVLKPGAERTLQYPLIPEQRGEARFGRSAIRVLTRWKLWQRIQFHGRPDTVKVYPNFAPIASAAAIGLEQQIAHLGIHMQQRRGEGSDFRQLREFREGDAMRQIDWKATARYRKPVSREYQDERDQDIVFLLDCGRRLRNKDDRLSHFDHALNALLLTSYVALRQGDAVGLMSFAGADRWLSPLKGPARINLILNQLFDLHSSTHTSDYLRAAEQFMSKNQKRSLVVLISNVREEDLEDLTRACRLMARKHLVMVANLRDSFLDKYQRYPVATFDDALTYCGLTEFSQRRREVLVRLQGMGVIVTDSLPHTLHMDLVTEYLRLKRSGRF